jgi:hypothetical protein
VQASDGGLGSDEDTYGHPHHPGAQGGHARNNLFQQHLPKMSFPRFMGRIQGFGKISA